MATYIVRRLVMAVPTLWAVLTVVFVGFRLVPGDSAQSLLLQAAPEGGQAGVSRHEMELLHHQLGLDRPVLVQYGDFLAHAVRLDFGRSFSSNQPVLKEIADRLPYTVEIAASALVLALVFGLLSGILAALYNRRAAGTGIALLGALGLAVPNFWLGTMLALVLGVELHWLPVAGSGDLRHLVLPAVTIAAGLSAVVMRYTRAAFVEVLSANFILVARAKGLGGRAILLTHTLRNAVIPLVTILGLLLAGLLSGVIIVERIFAWPGLGTLTLDAISARDYPVLEGLAFFFALVVMSANLLVDIAYCALDPRIKGNLAP